ncbi:hypothetical protein I5Q34_00690 [Streptomyces sp. AV19]|uniref:hypothetical protein n=1 Tax=Streptomyces sp. AV19 TaxID=2793068 RepID=UPI0018FE8712|nr:hypothetical protein [Streptomyces sp. AV19]MBH1932825.1 hypothetical protein [Streptomyces sp. AV19]MDG4531490.1 hypothetical protein [Streptomyces sp. AV19]
MTAADARTHYDKAVPNCLKAIGGLVLWLFAGATFLFAPLMAMASDPCGPADTELICTAAGQQLVVYIPLGTALVAAPLGTWGLVSRRETARLAWLLAMAMLVVTWMVTSSIATPPS